ncbi:hypothetical protein KC367_g1058 [Hortaea werneckii]|uniref:Uncharacterized protein n=1 Tax=Hortaea werneckii TaxID=91943 RepID=A0A3M7J3A4_HORWE|nr:hypothetical protein KC350_g18025 [Hortaea werneckii]KAI6791439.1 hypothetical protein KC358_g17782 [Hortaea werneckii]KAI6810555.1 hypothetical protein KC342_g17998 [Hortaea werneckii]KAI6897603.1 hypothetical protein KC348_g17685 [Hortaea werneckii]KAI6918626.1 hypothetical protein KC341_g17773 [Hortaea werneckii]
MTTKPPLDLPTTNYAFSQSRRSTASPGHFEEPFVRQYAAAGPISDAGFGHSLTVSRQRLQRTGERDLWTNSQPPAALSLPRIGVTSAERQPSSYAPSYPSPQAQRFARDQWQPRQSGEYRDLLPASPWPGSPLVGQFSTDPMSPAADSSSRSGYGYHGSWPGQVVHRSSSEELRLNQYAGFYGGEGSSSASSLHAKAYPQRRPSNRDEFDGPSQLLDKPEDGGYEPKEEELPQLPVTLYAQEQDEILSKVNDRLSQCAFDFVAKYQFPIPIEPDKRPVRVPGDREWSEWVYLLKRLATKRRIPARVLYNGQIKQLITILENSLEMRHAAKHQSRPLKDDRNILQLISSGLQVAKILKDAPAMQYLDSLYVQTERLIGSRRAQMSPPFSSA